MLLLAGAAVSAQDRVYVNFQDSFLRGESNDPNHPLWIDAYGLEHGATTTGGPPTVNRVSFLKGVDRATPRLNWLVATQNTLATDVIIDVCHEPSGGPQQCYYRLTARGVRIGRVTLAGQACIDPDTCGASQSESVELVWARLKWTFTKFDAKGGTTTFTSCYDATKNNYSCF